MARSGTVTRRKVSDVYDISLTSDHALLARPGRQTIAQQFCQRFREAIRRHGSKFFAIVKLQRAAGDTAEAMRFLQDRLEYRLEVAGRGVDDLENFRGRGLLLTRFG